MIYVKEQLGHSSIQVTVDLYGHVQPGENRDAVNRPRRAYERHLVGGSRVRTIL